MYLDNKHLAVNMAKPIPPAAPKIDPVLAKFYKDPENSKLGKKLMSIMRKEILETLQDKKEIKISWNELGKGSHYNPNNGEIKIDPELVTSRDTTILKFVASHEGSHKVITKYSALIEKVLGKDATEIKAIGYSSLCNAVEDPRVNNWRGRDKPKALAWQKKTYQPQFAKENTVMAAGASKAVYQMLGYAPLFLQYQSELLRWWFTSTHENNGQYSKKLDQRVQDVLTKTQPHFEQAYTLLPENRDDVEIIKTAEESFKIIHEKIWNNGYKELLDEVKDLDRLRQMMMDPKIAEKIWDSLPDEMKAEIEKNIKEALDELENNGLKPEQGQGGFPIDPNKLSKELQERLKEVFKNLPAGDKKQLTEKSDKALGQAEDKMNDGYESGLSDKKMPRHADEPTTPTDPDDKSAAEPVAEPLEKPIDENPEKDFDQPQQPPKIDTKKIMDDLNKADELRKTRGTNYQKAVVKYRREIDAFTTELQKIFQQRIYPTHRYNLSEGEINTSRIPDFYRDPSTVETMFMERRLPQRYDYCFSILVDMSGSMQGGNIQGAFDALAILCESFRRLKGIKLEIIGFNNVPFMIKSYKEELTKVYDKLNSIIDEAKDGTNDRAAIAAAYQNILKQNADERFIIVLSDGQGSGLEDILAKIRKERKMPTPIGLGVGPGTDFVAESYTVSMPSIDIKRLPLRLAKLIKDMVEHPKKYQTDKKTIIKDTGQKLNLLEKRGD